MKSVIHEQLAWLPCRWFSTCLLCLESGSLRERSSPPPPWGILLHIYRPAPQSFSYYLLQSPLLILMMDAICFYFSSSNSVVSNSSMDNHTSNYTTSCGTYEQLEYWPNNFDDFAVSKKNEISVTFSNVVPSWENINKKTTVHSLTHSLPPPLSIRRPSSSYTTSWWSTTGRPSWMPIADTQQSKSYCSDGDVGGVSCGWYSWWRSLVVSFQVGQGLLCVLVADLLRDVGQLVCGANFRGRFT